jgi:tetratricopeptide (TPR) repeat protein
MLSGGFSMRLLLFAILASASLPASAQNHEHESHADMAAPELPVILDGYGDGGFPITTKNPQAQAFFNNGMQLAHGFAHKAAVAAMQEAERLDPDCAMCVWGEAWAGGPTINFGKEGDELKNITQLATKAQKLAQAHGTPTERALTAALVARYQNGGGSKPGDLAFAQAMERISKAHPTDDAFATIAADAWLIAPGDNDREVKRDLQHSIALLERVLARSPNYTPAMHFYIHATEYAGEPEKAEPYANRLGELAPNAAHLIHMPSHTFYWVGRYQDAANANVKAVEVAIAQAKKLNLPDPDGLWGLPYHLHNITYGIGGALMAGDAATAMALAKPLVAKAASRTDDTVYKQTVASSGYFAYARFAEPADALSLPEPKLPILKGAWRYMRGEVLAREKKPADVRAEAAAITPLPGERKAASILLDIEGLVLQGRAAMLEAKPADALARFEKAAALQEDKQFASITDPPAFWYPVRRSVAEAKLAMGDMAGARAALEASLKIRPKDPAALALLAKLDGKTAAR